MPTPTSLPRPLLAVTCRAAAGALSTPQLHQATDGGMGDVFGSFSFLALHGSKFCRREPLNATQHTGARL